MHQSRNNISVYITTRDRPELLRQCLDSVLNQSMENFDLIISDNSVGDETAKLITEHYPTIDYIRRQPPTAVADHVFEVISECKTDYIVIFHDDDLMETNYTQKMAQLISQHPSIAAIGCNAFVLTEEGISSEPYMRDRNEQVIIPSLDYLAESYISLGRESPAPFPGYIYKTAIAKEFYKSSIFKKGGLYSDLSFLMHIQEHAKILWTPEILMTYRLHKNNASSTESIPSRLSLLRLLFKKTSIKPNSRIVIEYKFRYYFKLITTEYSKLKKQHPRRHKVIMKFLTLNLLPLAIRNPVFLHRATLRTTQFFKRLIRLCPD